jgi:two-component system sensor histidine kinase VicK
VKSPPGDELKLLFDTLADPLVACDGQERIVLLTRTAEQLLGYTEEELRGQPFTRIVPPRLHEIGGRSLLRYLRERCLQYGSHSILVPLQRQGGTELLLEVSTGHTGEGEQERITLSLRRVPEIPLPSPEPFAQDLSVKHWKYGHLGARLHPGTARRRYQLIFDNAPLGIFHFDTTPVITTCNDYFVRIIGSSKQLLIGLNLLTLHDPRVLSCVAATLDGKHAHFEGDYVSVTAEKVTPVRAHFTPCHDREGKVSGGVGIVEDVTEQRQIEEERARLLREAQEAVRVRDDFLTIASHELKTPLTPLSLRLANLERKLERGESVDPTALRHARQQLLRLTSLINDLLDASRIQSGGLALHPQPTRLDALTEHVIHLMERLYDAEHRVHFHRPAQPLQVRGDPYRLEQVITNLLENALKYSPNGGPIHVSLEERDSLALLSVSDPGIGIPADQQQRLFERYFRARNVSTKSYGGLGLGLYICRDIIERHGGRIWVESEVGRGSTFYVALPTLTEAQDPLEHSPGHAMH